MADTKSFAKLTDGKLSYYDMDTGKYHPYLGDDEAAMEFAISCFSCMIKEFVENNGRQVGYDDLSPETIFFYRKFLNDADNFTGNRIMNAFRMAVRNEGLSISDFKRFQETQKYIDTLRYLYGILGAEKVDVMMLSK